MSRPLEFWEERLKITKWSLDKLVGEISTFPSTRTPLAPVRLSKAAWHRRKVSWRRKQRTLVRMCNELVTLNRRLNYINEQISLKRSKTAWDRLLGKPLI